MEKKVILLTDFYLPNNNANGLCIHRIGKAMQKQGYEVHVVAYLEDGLQVEEEIEDIQVHRVRPMSFYKMRSYYYKHGDNWKGKLCWKLALLGRRVKKILLMPWYPLVSPIAALRYCKVIEQVAEKYSIQNIVAGYNPFESAFASVWLKRKHNYSIIAYFMDTFTLTANAKKSRMIFETGRKWEHKIYELADGISNFPTYKEYFSGEAYKKYQYKMMYAGVPTDFDELANYGEGGEDYYRNERINLLYTGGLTMGDREPMYLLDLMEACNEKDVQIHFFSRGNAEDYLKKKQMTNDWIVSHGQVPFNELLKARRCANIMVNIGSQREIILPSRLFEYIASGKPIIHIVYRKDDPCIEVLEKHPDALILYVDASKMENVGKLRKFIKEKSHVEIPLDELKQIYLEYEVGNIAKQFDNIFQNSEE